jgi:hypothetical protein
MEDLRFVPRAIYRLSVEKKNYNSKLICAYIHGRKFRELRKAIRSALPGPGGDISEDHHFLHFLCLLVYL